jgi:hypothetical protein
VSTLATFVSGLELRIKDGAAKLSTDEKNAAVAAAVEHFSKVRPLEKALLINGDGSFDYTLDGLTPDLAGWSDGFSSFVAIFYPWDATAQVPTPLGATDFGVFRLSTGLVLRFITCTPQTGEKFLAHFNALHTVTGAASTILPADEEAFKDLCAAFACEALASHYSQSTDGSISADTVAHLSKAQEYRAQAKRWREAYLAKMGGDGADSPAAAVSAVQSVFPTVSRDRHFFHGGR